MIKEGAEQEVVCELEIASNAAKAMISLLRTFEKLSPFVTLQFDKEHLLVTVINTSMTMFSVVRLDAAFFARYALLKDLGDLGIKLDTLLFCNSLRCEGIVNNTSIKLKENSIDFERQLLAEGGNQKIKLNYEVVDFIQAVTPPMEAYEGNLLVALGSVWSKAFDPHLSTVDTQIQLHFNTNNVNLQTSIGKLCTQNCIPSTTFHTWKIQNELKIVAPLYELELISAVAGRLKALLQIRFGPGLPLIIEMVSMGGCLARFVMSVIEGELRDVNQRITHHRKKKQQQRPATTTESFEAGEELEEMLIDSDENF